MALLTLSLLSLVGTSSAQQRTFEARADVVVVEVPVQVLAGREPVRGLTQTDFVVTEGRQKIPIVGFEVVDLDLSESGRYWTQEDEDALPAAGRRHFLFLFDLSFSDPSSILRARDAAKELVISGLHPADLAGVAVWSAARGAQLVLNFTGDRRQILAAIESLGVADPLDVVSDPLKVVVSSVAADFEVAQLDSSPRQADVPGRDQRLEMWLQSTVDQQLLAGRAVREQVQQQIMSFSGSMLDVAGLLQGIDGTSHVVLLSEGFDSSVLLGTSVADEASRQRIEEIQRAVENGESWRVDSDERFGNSMALFGLSQTLEAFNRAGAAIQAVDIGGLRAQGNEGSALRDAQTRQDGLFILANDTGGELYRNYNKLSDAMGDLLTRTSVTYLLAIQPDTEPDGAYHRIDVKLKNGPKNARLVHRPGYTAPLPYSATDPTRRRIENTELLLGEGEGGSIGSAVMALPVPTAGSDDVLARVWVPVLIEVEGPSLLAGTTGDRLPIELYGYAVREDGSIADFFAQALSIDLGESRSLVASRGFKFWGNLDLRPGDYRLRTLVRNAQTGGLSLATTPLDVVDPTRSEAFLAPALLPEEPGRWVLAQERDDALRSSYPFVAHGEMYLPAVRPTLDVGSSVDLWVAGQGFDPAAARVVASLVPASGGDPLVVRAEPVAAAETATAGDAVASPLTAFEIRLAVPEAPAGRYRLTLELTEPSLRRPLWSELAVQVR